MATKKRPRGKPFPPGVSANPAGRPPLSPELKAVRELSASIVKKIFAKYAYMSRVDILDFMKDLDASMIDRVIAASLLKAEKDGDLAKLEYLLNRTIGKVAEKTEVKMPTPFTITRKSGDQVVLGAKMEDDGDDSKKPTDRENM